MRILGVLIAVAGLFCLSMYAITNGVLDIVAYASAPIILSSLGIATAMIYASTFHGESETAAVHRHAVPSNRFKQEFFEKHSHNEELHAKRR